MPKDNTDYFMEKYIEFQQHISHAQNIIFDLCKLSEDDEDMLSLLERDECYLLTIANPDRPVISAHWNKDESAFEIEELTKEELDKVLTDDKE